MLFENEQHLGDCGLTREAAHDIRPPEKETQIFRRKRNEKRNYPKRKPVRLPHS